MIIEVNIDTIEIVGKELFKDYILLNESISRFYEKYKDTGDELVIPSYKIENLNLDIKYRDAIEIILEYYLTHDEYKKKVLEQ